jgi:hypothetical protein
VSYLAPGSITDATVKRGILIAVLVSFFSGLLK